MKTTILALALGAALLAGCGKQTILKPAENQTLPQRPQTASVQPGSPDLLNAGTQARPRRFDELVIKSQELQSDRFDMPPPG